MVREGKTQAFDIRTVLVIKVEVEVTEENVFTWAEAVIVEKGRELLVEDRSFEQVGRIGRGAIDDAKDDRVARDVQGDFSNFEGSV